MQKMELLSVVALLNDLPEHGFLRGQVGTVVEPLSDSVVLVEFSGEDGATYALVPVPIEGLIRLLYSQQEQVA
jgi:hypothetical protein